MYAKDTSVPVERSKAEIEKLVRKYGADQFQAGWDLTGARVGFKLKDRYVSFRLPIPLSQKDTFVRGRLVTGVSQEKTDQLTRSRWRALLLVIKAKLEAVECGISDFETEFLGNIVVGGGKTVADLVKPGLAETYARGGQLALPSGLGG